jgi:hypothetical protein
VPRALVELIPLRWLVAALVAATTPTTGAELIAGRYDGEFCVTVGESPQTCGAVDVHVLSAKLLMVRVADISYQLQLRSSQLLDVVTMHGAMQIDGFEAPYVWRGETLQFYDLSKRTCYQLLLADSQLQAVGPGALPRNTPAQTPRAAPPDGSAPQTASSLC